LTKLRVSCFDSFLSGLTCFLVVRIGFGLDCLVGDDDGLSRDLVGDFDFDAGELPSSNLAGDCFVGEGRCDDLAVDFDTGELPSNLAGDCFVGEGRCGDLAVGDLASGRPGDFDAGDFLGDLAGDFDVAAAAGDLPRVFGGGSTFNSSSGIGGMVDIADSFFLGSSGVVAILEMGAGALIVSTGLSDSLVVN
jgi:hypothetical protein